MPEGRIATQVRIKASLWAKLKAIAQIEHRSTNAQLECFLAQSVTEYETKQSEETSD